jgi:protein-tyrosine-phosphatase/DNA-binding transcriptional ArsR family regulator
MHQTNLMYSAGMVTFTRTDVPPFIRLVGHPLRWRLLAELATSDRRVRELVESVGEPQNLVSYHLRVLKDAGLVTGRRSSHDGRDLYYRLEPDRCAEGLASAGARLHLDLALAAPPPHSATTRGRRSGVLFVCTGNTTRSPIAEALLRHHSGGAVTTASAGVAPGERMQPHAVRVLRERFDIDIEDSTPRSVDDVLRRTTDRRRFGRVVTLCDRARERLVVPAGLRHTHWSVPDPADAQGSVRYSSFVAAATEIDARVRHLIAALESDHPRPVTTAGDNRR